MNRVQLRALIELIDDLTNEDAPYIEKRDKVVNLCTEGERISLDEFVSWFEQEPRE